MSDNNINIFWVKGNSNHLFIKAAQVREEVFCDEQGYSLKQELDDIDNFAHHIIVEIDGVPVGTGRFFFANEEDEKRGVLTIGRIAVKQVARGLKLGKLVMDELEKKAVELNAGKLKLSAQCRVGGFYEKCGFAAVGDTYLDGHVLHQMMEKSWYN